MMESDVESEDEFLDGEMSLEEIDAAYRLALETAESAEALLSQSIDKNAGSDLNESLSVDPLEGSQDDSSVGEETPIQRGFTNSDLAEDERPLIIESEERLTLSQVIEGLLFVGGNPLPAKKIVDVLGGATDHEQIDELIEQINQHYAKENRPYVIQLIEGGYTMVLDTEYEPVRRRVYGQGPKDVKLSQEALEVLAFVAYKQPINREDVDEIGKKNAGGLLRQLLRRQLIALERNEDSNDESYRTTKRFLDLFGLGSVDDLPQAIDFEFK
jgi:segregation and condensation protein B